ncbi:hypothetical protein M9H77_31211 [Catharanthus roseus]|uniref:Uncharacterized protein n=1 Tax=Catharanthus roseus TaxID=4058 RepID=A0ACB9ZZS3_CATRO|nr:hypothetical protein M9H77_31211 [Catharanthus roseus]
MKSSKIFKDTYSIKVTKKRGKNIQFRGCEGFGHIQAECANTIKKNSYFNTTLSDDERNEETDYDEGDETEHTVTVALNVVVDMKGTTLHGVLKCVDDNENRVDNEKNNAENDE